jgi:hypothetical protein
MELYLFNDYIAKPTATLMLHHILRIARHLNAFENDILLRCVVIPMKDKFLKYWRDIPIIYADAFILDPRAKMSGFNKVLSHPDLRDKVRCVSYVRQRRTTHIMAKCIEINVTNIINVIIT